MIALPNTIAQGKAKESNPQRERVAVERLGEGRAGLDLAAGHRPSTADTDVGTALGAVAVATAHPRERARGASAGPIES